MSIIKVYKVKDLLLPPCDTEIIIFIQFNLTLHSCDVDYGNVAYQCVHIFNAHATKLYTYLGEHSNFFIHGVQHIFGIIENCCLINEHHNKENKTNGYKMCQHFP